MKAIARGALSSDRLVTALFVLLVVLQLLDLHATLTASAHQVERNRLITWISQRYPFAAVVACIKAVDVGVLGLMYGVWRKTAGRLDVEFAIATGVLATIYLAVVTNNYLR